MRDFQERPVSDTIKNRIDAMFIELGRQTDQDKSQALKTQLLKFIKHRDQLAPYLKNKNLKDRQIQFLALLTDVYQEKQKKEAIIKEYKKILKQDEEKIQQLKEEYEAEMEKERKLKDKCIGFTDFKRMKGITEFLDEHIEKEQAKQNKLSEMRLIIDNSIKFLQPRIESEKQKKLALQQSITKIKDQIEVQKSELKNLKKQKRDLKEILVKGDTQILKSQIEQKQIQNRSDRSSMTKKIGEGQQTNEIPRNVIQYTSRRTQILRIKQKETFKKWMSKYGIWVTLQVLVGLFLLLS